MRAHVREMVEHDEPWTLNVTTVIKAGGSSSAWEAYQTNLAKKRINPNHRFRLQFQNLRRLDITPTEVVELGPPALRKDGKDAGTCLLKQFLPAASTRKVNGTRMDMECVMTGGMPGAVRASDSAETTAL